jgi:hypothetical protein
MPKPLSLNLHIKEWMGFYQNEGRYYLPFKLKEQATVHVVQKKENHPPKKTLSPPPVEIAKPALQKESSAPTQELTFVEDLEMRSFFQTVFPKQPHLEFFPPIVLLHPPMDERERDFLTKLTGAITNHVMTAQMLPFKRELLDEKTPRLFLVPIDLLQHAFPQFSFSVHKVMEGTPTILPLSSLKQYTHDVDQKRDLWRTLNSPKLNALLKSSSM